MAPRQLAMPDEAYHYGRRCRRLENAVNFLERSNDLEMTRSKLQRHGIERIVGKGQRMGIADLRLDRQIALASAALTLSCHVRAAVHGMNFERWINGKKPQRNVVCPRTNVSTQPVRQMLVDCGSELRAPP